MTYFHDNKGPPPSKLVTNKCSEPTSFSEIKTQSLQALCESRRSAETLLRSKVTPLVNSMRIGGKSTAKSCGVKMKQRERKKEKDRLNSWGSSSSDSSSSELSCKGGTRGYTFSDSP